MKRTFRLPNKNLNEKSPAFIIAEIGINHQGSVDIAKKLILKARECGADAVKFQKRSISRILTKAGLDMSYENRNSFGKTYGEHKRALELTKDNYKELKKFTEQTGLFFSASGWDEESIDFLMEIDIPFFKMASADLSNFPLLEHTAKKGKPIILSTGMADINLVKSALSLVQKHNTNIAILQCTSTYPAQFNEINLNVIKSYLDIFPNNIIGYSGHELGISIPGVAVAMGAKIIEKHFTLDRTMKGGDHAASLEPLGFSKMVRDIRHIEDAMGDFDKKLQDSEKPVLKKLGKSIVTAKNIKKGEKITVDMLTTKGPGNGVSPTKYNDLIGKKLKYDHLKDVVIKDESVIW